MEGKDKKQLLLRIPKKLYDDLAKWADEDFRSVNGQLEYLIHECVTRRKKSENPFKRNEKEEESAPRENVRQ